MNGLIIIFRLIPLQKNSLTTQRFKNYFKNKYTLKLTKKYCVIS